MYIVVWTIRHDPRTGPDRDCWQAVDTLEDAEAIYRHLVGEDGIYTVSLCSVVKSTDYDGKL